MPDRLTETEMTESLDQRGRLEAARNPGVYALDVAVPDDIAAVREAWDAVFATRHPQLARLANAERVAYVGAKWGSVYRRLCDHCNGVVRQATLLQAFDPTRVIDVAATEHPFQEEWSAAQGLARWDWTVWVDGEVVG